MIVVTGGAGFIGSNIVAALDERSDREVVVCDRLRGGEKWRNIAKRYLRDIVDPDALDGFLARHGAGIDAIIHMGAITATTETDADLTIDTNFRLSTGLWTWCAERGVPLIYASSAATYGDGGAGFDDDASEAALARLRPLNLYGWSKHLFDRWLARRLAHGDAAPPQWAGLKFFNVYGPNEQHKGPQSSVINQIFPVVRAGDPVRLFQSHNRDYADGGQLRDFVWVEDCVNVVLWLLETPAVSGLFNCGSGTARSFLDLANAVFAAAGIAPRIEFVPTPEAIRDKYQYFTEASLGRLRAAGYTAPFTPLEEGVNRYVRNFLDTDDPYR